MTGYLDINGLTLSVKQLLMHVSISPLIRYGSGFQKKKIRDPDLSRNVLEYMTIISIQLQVVVLFNVVTSGFEWGTEIFRYYNITNAY